jgi:hypothetical protein
MNLSPDVTQACWELGSAVFGTLNIRAIRKSKRLEGVHWVPTAFFFAWGIYNLWFYAVLQLPVAWWGGMVITIVNMVWLGHVAFYTLPGWLKARATKRRENCAGAGQSDAVGSVID